MKLAARGKPNAFLRQQRLLRGWSLQHVAGELHALCEQENQAIGVTADMVGKWERGDNKPSLFYQEKLCRLYGLSAAQLGFIGTSQFSYPGEVRQAQSTNNTQHSEITIDDVLKAEDMQPAATLPTLPPSTLSASQGHATIRDVPSRQLLLLSDTSVAQESGLQDTNRSRRQILQQMLGLTGSATLMPTSKLLDLDILERLAKALQKPSRVDETILINLETTTKNNRRRFVISKSKSSARYNLLHEISGHLKTITQLLEYSQPIHTYKRLCSLAGETSQLVGDILFNAGDSDIAEIYYNAALEAAKEGRNDILRAVILGRKSFIPIYGGDPQRALQFLQEAHTLTAQNASDIIRAWLSAVKGEAYANAHDANACLKVLENAELLLERKQPGAGSYGFTEEAAYAIFNLSRMLSYKGTCYVRLKQPEAAQAILREVLASAGPAHLQQKSITLVDLGMTYVQQDEISEACKYAGQALNIVEQTGSVRVLQRIRNLRRELRSWESTSYVKDLDEQFAAVLSSIILGRE
jgi:tetratricopeptide (TPR) repeat protein/transcriptional regulator with XRE-family HTH domain